jgi:hypothetical protein
VIDIAERFNQIAWHDSKLLEVSSYQSPDAEGCVRLRVALGGLAPMVRLVDVLFLHGSYIEMDIDIDGKALCGDAISEAYCPTTSPWLDKLLANHYRTNFYGYHHFRVVLVDPGGSLNVLAKDFILRDVVVSK